MVVANIMKKFQGLYNQETPIPNTAQEREFARFGHLNRMIEDYQTFTTIISAEQAATLSSVPVQLNVPEGMYLLAGGYIYYSSTATEFLEIGESHYISIGDDRCIIYKGSAGVVNAGSILFMSPYTIEDVRLLSGKVYFNGSVDATTPPDGPLEITVYLTKLNLSII